MIVTYDKTRMRKETYYSTISSKQISVQYRKFHDTVRECEKAYQKSGKDYYCWFDWSTGEYFVGHSYKNYKKWKETFPYTRRGASK